MEQLSNERRSFDAEVTNKDVDGYCALHDLPLNDSN